MGRRRRKIKKILKNNKNNSQIHFVQRILKRLICYTNLVKARRFVKDIYIVLITEISSNLAEYHVQAIEEKINKFDYAEADFIALNADKDEHIICNIQMAENKDENEEDIISKSTVVRLWECYWNQCF